ncbi:hypothetical protein D3C79_1087490 [compost metagenome]
MLRNVAFGAVAVLVMRVHSLAGEARKPCPGIGKARRCGLMVQRYFREVVELPLQNRSYNAGGFKVQQVFVRLRMAQHV